MTELLTKIIEAHGGLDRWNGFSRVRQRSLPMAPLGHEKPDAGSGTSPMTAWLHEERSSVAPFGDPDWHTEFTPADRDPQERQFRGC